MHANRALADHIGRVGKLPVLDLFTWDGPPSPADSSSTPVVAHLEQTIRLVRDRDMPEGPILLCHTTMRTGWSFSVCAALLAEAGCHHTMPLVIHRLP
jgi:ATP-dependent DNA helicase RecQ